jgi:anaerobic selenocysteine-containing dehydrogenase
MDPACAGMTAEGVATGESFPSNWNETRPKAAPGGLFFAAALPHHAPIMNQAPRIEHRPSVCPHDCPSACSLDVEVIEGRSIGRVHGARSNSYTAGVICAKVARYAERIHHPDRLLHPLRRTGPKGSGSFERISWDEALDIVAREFLRAERAFGVESVWPYYYAGTMGLVMRDGINRLRHVKKYSGQYSTICTAVAWTGYVAGTGKLAGSDPREMGASDCVVIWGTNPVHTQVNVMTHAMRARKERGAKIVAVDIYMNATMKQADMALLLRPGTDGALACAVMHVLFRDGHADWDYLDRYTDCPRELEAHLRSRDPAWAAAITGLSVEEIEAFARLVGEDQTQLLPPRLRLRAPAQRRGQHARGGLHPGRDRRMAARGRRRIPLQQRHLRLEQGADRRARGRRSVDPQAGPVADRAHPHGRPGGAVRRPSRQGHAGPEHQPGFRRAGAGAGEAGLRARGPVRVRARAVHDRNGPHGRHRAARHHVPGA